MNIEGVEKIITVELTLDNGSDGVGFGIATKGIRVKDIQFERPDQDSRFTITCKGPQPYNYYRNDGKVIVSMELHNPTVLVSSLSGTRGNYLAPFHISHFDVGKVLTAKEIPTITCFTNYPKPIPNVIVTGFEVCEKLQHSAISVTVNKKTCESKFHISITQPFLQEANEPELLKASSIPALQDHATAENALDYIISNINSGSPKSIRELCVDWLDKEGFRFAEQSEYSNQFVTKLMRRVMCDHTHIDGYRCVDCGKSIAKEMSLDNVMDAYAELSQYLVACVHQMRGVYNTGTIARVMKVFASAPFIPLIVGSVLDHTANIGDAPSDNQSNSATCDAPHIQPIKASSACEAYGMDVD